MEDLRDIEIINIGREPGARVDTYHIQANLDADILGHEQAAALVIDYWIDTETNLPLRIELTGEVNLPGEAVAQPDRKQVRYLLSASFRYFGYGKSLNIVAPGNVVSSDPVITADDIQAGDVLMATTFDDQSDWEYYVFPEDGYDLQVIDGVYRIQADADNFAWGLNYEVHENAIIEVTVTRNTLESEVIGLMCRADPRNNGDGYYFLISNFNDFAIILAEGDDFTQLVTWRMTPLVSNEQNQYVLKAVCYEDRLAFYIDGVLVAEAIDDTFSSGFAGLVAIAGINDPVDVFFDDLTIWEAIVPDP